MTGKDDAAAADRAELAALRAKAAERRAEVDATARALAGELADGPGLRAYTRQAMQAAARHAVEAAWHAARKAVLPGSAASSPTIAAGTRRAGPAGWPVPAAALGLTAFAAAAALTWRLRRGQATPRPRSRSGR